MKRLLALFLALPTIALAQVYTVSPTNDGSPPAAAAGSIPTSALVDAAKVNSAVQPGGAVDTNSLYGTSLAARAFRLIDPRDLGAVCNGSAANAAADLAGWQAAVNKAIATGAKVGMFSGACYFPANQGVTVPAGTTNLGIEGGGQGVLTIKFASAPSSSCLFSIGDSTALTANVFIKGIELDGASATPSADGSCGISATRAFKLHLDNVAVRFLDTGFFYNGVYSSSVARSFANQNNKGVNLAELVVSGVGTFDPNNIDFFNTTLFGNYTYGLLATAPSQLNYYGGSIEHNGTTTGSASNWGAKIVNAGNEGPAGGGFHGTYFEANAGTADVWLQQDTGASTFTFDHPGFDRQTTTAFTTNNILIAGSAASQIVSINDPSFWSTAGYTPSSSTQYVNKTNNNASVVIKNPYCLSAVECKYSRQLSLLASNNTSGQGLSIVNPTGFELYREYTNPTDDSVHLEKGLGNGDLYVQSNKAVRLLGATGTVLPKLASAPTAAPGAGLTNIFAVAGTNAGTCKLQMLAGTSTTPVTIVDNVGSGC